MSPSRTHAVSAVPSVPDELRGPGLAAIPHESIQSLDVSGQALDAQPSNPRPNRSELDGTILALAGAPWTTWSSRA
jgi:hypothetical protein